LYPAPSGPTTAATADLNGDGKPDLAIGNTAAGSVSIVLGKGGGTFTAGTTIAVPADA